MFGSNLKLAGPLRNIVEAEWEAGQELLDQARSAAMPMSGDLVEQLRKKNEELRGFLDAVIGEPGNEHRLVPYLHVVKITAGHHANLRTQLESALKHDLETGGQAEGEADRENDLG